MVEFFLVIVSKLNFLEIFLSIFEAVKNVLVTFFSVLVFSEELKNVSQTKGIYLQG